MMRPGQQVLVTGADGFIGSHLVEHLVAEGARVRALVQYNSMNSWGWLEEVPCAPEGDVVDVVAGDVRDPDFCRDLARNIDTVFHLAALIPIPYSYRAPASYVDTNVMGTLNLCQAARAHGVSKFIQVSTSEVYGTAQYVPIDEAHPLRAQSPYSASKVAADAIATSFFHSFDLPVTIARPFNTYGPRQSARAVIPTIISQLASGASTLKLGNLSTTRDFTYVEDTCLGLMAIAALDSGLGETINIGSDSEISVGDLATMIAGIMKTSATVEVDERRLRPVASEVNRLRCDNSKLRRLTGFKPRVELAVGLGRTVEWFLRDDHLRRYKADSYNV